MRTFKLPILALASLAFVGCCNDDDEPEKGRTAVQLTNARIVESTSTDTRATDNAWEPADAIGLVMLQAGTNTPVDGKTALKYTTATAAGSFQPADEANTGYYPSEGKEADILAFYPYAQIGTDLMVPVNTADQSTLSRIDLMVADKSAGHSENKPGVDLSFSHKLAQLVITVTKDASANDVDLTGATIKLIGTAATAKWSLAEARLIDEGAATDITLVATITKETLNATAIALPTAAGKTVKLVLTITNGETFTLKAEDAFALVAGKKNKLTVAVKKTDLTITGITIEPWQTVDEGEVGTLPGTAHADGTKPLDPTLFNAEHPTWIVTGGGTPEADATVLANVRDALNRIYAPYDAEGIVNPDPYTGTARIDLQLPEVNEINYFRYYGQLRSISAPKATTIGKDALRECATLATINLPKATDIGEYAFRDCIILKTIDLPEATSIGNVAFYECKALETIDLPMATSIGNSAFLGCSDLKSITAPLATGIGNYAFFGCSDLKTLSLPVATSIGICAFEGCAALTRLELTAAGDFTFLYNIFKGFNTAACDLVLNPDKAKDTGTATPKVTADDKWGFENNEKPWKSITHAAPSPSNNNKE